MPLLFPSCSEKKEVVEINCKENLAYDVNSWKKNWEDASQNVNGKVLYEFTDNSMRFRTEAGTKQRAKLKTLTKIYTTGTYHWKVYVPTMEMSSRVSIGAFLYYDDWHELDFEIGSGKAATREKYNAKEDEVLMYVTSQNYPYYQSVQTLKTEKWYDLSMHITLTDNKYLIK